MRIRRVSHHEIIHDFILRTFMCPHNSCSVFTFDQVNEESLNRARLMKP